MELIIAVAIFSVVITITIGCFSMAIRAQKRVILLQNVQENAQFILEFIAKEIRMSVINTTNGLSNSLNITRSSDNNSVIYSFDSGKLTRNGVSMNSEDVDIAGSFYISGVGADNLQPKLTILMKLNNQTEEEIVVNTQATLSQRLLSFE